VKLRPLKNAGAKFPPSSPGRLSAVLLAVEAAASVSVPVAASLLTSGVGDGGVVVIRRSDV
jgi:hypothetical protein